MQEPEGHVLTLNCDCGNQFKESLTGKDLDTYEFNCPACGVGERLKPEQVAAIVGAVDAAAQELNESLRRVAEQSPWLKYTPK
ncbi:hypothetical protein WBP06_09340 [Novosphingobium sp. BL-8H]|uniref:hypothetical protein n=1 Tax=Novosphingobium sp. BL-8H TaxID=3127640 RepID=UPI003757C92D